MPPPRMCTMVAGVVYQPVTGEAASYTNGCERQDLIDAGYVDTKPN